MKTGGIDRLTIKMLTVAPIFTQNASNIHYFITKFHLSIIRFRFGWKFEFRSITCNQVDLTLNVIQCNSTVEFGPYSISHIYFRVSLKHADFS